MNKKHRAWHGSALSFIDMLWNLLLVFTMLFLLSIVEMAVDNEAKKTVELKAEYIIQLDWNDYSPADIDLWLKSPDDFIGFKHQSNGWIALDRDDRGNNDSYEVPGQETQVIPTRREVISVKKKVPGRYVVDVMFFHLNTVFGKIPEGSIQVPVPCRIQLIQVNPFKIIYSRDLKLEHPGDEITAFSYLVDDKGEVVDISTMDEPFVRGLPDGQAPAGSHSEEH